MNFKLSLTDVYFLFSIFLITFFKSAGYSSGDVIYKIAMFISVVLCILKIIFDLENGINRTIMYKYIIFALIVLINSLIIEDITIVITLIIFLAARNVSLIKILKILLFSKILGFLFNIILFKIGFKSDRVIEIYRDEIIYRSTYGFGHPNLMHYIYASIIILIIVLYYKKINIFYTLLILTSNYYLYAYFTLSRTGYYNVIILIVLFYLFKLNFLKKFLNLLSLNIQNILILVTTIFSIYFSNTELFYYIDRLLTGRFNFSKKQLDYGVSLFGNKFDDPTLYFDNSYSMMISMYGILITFVFLYIYYRTVKLVVLYKIEQLSLLMLIFSIYMFTESYMPSIVMNITLFVCSKFYFKEFMDVKKDFNL